MTPRSVLSRLLAPAALAAAVTACGTAPAPSAFQSNAPSSAMLSIDVGNSTTTSAALPADPTATTPPMSGPAVRGPCHPHLFARTAEVAARINAIFRRHLRHVDALVARHPDLLAGNTATWTETGSGVEVQRRFTLTRSADGLTWTFELELAPAGQAPPAWTKVLDGSMTDSTSGDVKERQGAMTLLEDALHAVLPVEPLTGTVAIAFDRIVDPSKPGGGVKRVTQVTFDAFSFGPGDRHGPRSGGFTHLSEPGLGGLMTFQDSLVLLCPANPSSLPADATTVSRWYRATDGSVHGRADAKATGGQIAAGDTWVGVTCHAGAAGADPATATEAGYWMMKLETASGATDQSFVRAEAGAGAVACDPAFGKVPSLVDASSDYDFGAPATFPGAW